MSASKFNKLPDEKRMQHVKDLKEKRARQMRKHTMKFSSNSPFKANDSQYAASSTSEDETDEVGPQP